MALSFLVSDQVYLGNVLFLIGFLLRGDIDREVLVNIMASRSKSLFMLAWLVMLLIFLISNIEKYYSYSLLVKFVWFAFPILLEMFVGDVKRCILYRK